ncbi:hypothetical protein ADUPG1_007858 [Aduncisulcus paluster]|uniref:AAA+ ATPase domain-containing protein n=1 Tax=Aduncisulcus paluster TaxID=2918883 RepID=A0ABQ5KRA4_9EUKA|nr:hypothetical protein ADUPG1_007858 [Aduncisulcus paluster]
MREESRVILTNDKIDEIAIKIRKDEEFEEVEREEMVVSSSSSSSILKSVSSVNFYNDLFEGHDTESKQYKLFQIIFDLVIPLFVHDYKPTTEIITELEKKRSLIQSMIFDAKEENEDERSELKDDFPFSSSFKLHNDTHFLQTSHFIQTPSTVSNINTLLPAILTGCPISLLGEAMCGKSSLANHIGKLRRNLFGTKSKIERFQCNQNSEKEAIFGSLSLSNSFSYELGPLTRAMHMGHIFILEDAHLLEPSILQQISNALSVFPGQQVPLPNNNSKVVVRHVDFMFVCTSRKPLSNVLPYVPILNMNLFNEADIISVCEYYSKCETGHKYHHLISRLFSTMMKQNKNLSFSFKDVNTLLNRLSYLCKVTKFYENCDVPHVSEKRTFFIQNVVPARLFAQLLISKIPQTKRTDILPDIYRIIDSVCNLSSSDSKFKDQFMKTEQWISSPVIVEKHTKMIKKGHLSIPLSAKKLATLTIHPRILQLIFLLECTSPIEHVLLVGETSYKSKALADWLNHIPTRDHNIPVFEFSRESEISSILGSEQLHTLLQIDETCEMMKKQLQNIGEESLTSGNHVIYEYIDELKRLKRCKRRDIRRHKSDPSSNQSIGFNQYCMNFVPSSLLTRAAIGRPAIIKNIALPPASVVESLCPLLHPDGPLFDIPKCKFFYNTNGTPKSTKHCMNTASRRDRFLLYATCHPRNYDKLSPAIKTRMTVIHVEPYSYDDISIVIENQFEASIAKIRKKNSSKMFEFKTSIFDQAKPKLVDIYEKASHHISIPFRSLILWIDSTVALLAEGNEDESKLFEEEEEEGREEKREELIERKYPDDGREPNISRIDISISISFVRSILDGIDFESRKILLKMLLQENMLPKSFLDIIPDQLTPDKDTLHSQSVSNALQSSSYSLLESVSSLSFEDYFSLNIIEKEFNRYVHVESRVSHLAFDFPVSESYSIPNLDEFIFVPTMIHMMDAFLTAVACNYPVFIESAPGIGKSACAQVVASILGLGFTRFNFSNSTSLEDLFGRYQSFKEKTRHGEEVVQFRRGEGALLAAIGKSNKSTTTSSSPTKIILFDETNLAPPEVLDVLLPMCTMSKRTVTCPDGSIIDCSHVLIFATLNPANISGSRNPIPMSLQQSVFYLNVPQYSTIELFNIAKAKISELKSLTEIDPVSKLIRAHATAMKVTKKQGKTDYSSLREIIKVIEIFNAANDANAPLDFTFILDLVYFSRFDPSMRNELMREAHISSSASQLCNSLLQPYRVLSKDGRISLHFGRARIDCTDWISNRDLAKFATFKIGEHIPIPHSLSSQQLVVMEKMASIIPTKRAILLLGSSGSGKSFLVETMAHVCQKKLRVIQLNSESEIGSIVGRLEPTPPEGQEKITNLIVEAIQIVLSPFSRLDRSLKSDAQKKIRILLKYIPDLLHENMTTRKTTLLNCVGIFPEFRRSLEACETFIQQSKANFQFVESILIDAMEQGDFFLLDNLQAAPSDVCERLNSLIEEKQRLYLFEKDSKTIYVENPQKPGEKPIHKDFRLFMTADPSRTGAHAIPPSFMSRCIAISTSKLVPDLSITSSDSISEGSASSRSTLTSVSNDQFMSSHEQFVAKNLVEIAARSMYVRDGIFANNKQLSLDYGSALACAFANINKLWCLSPPSDCTTQFSVRSFFHTLQSFDIIMRKQRSLPESERSDPVEVLRFVLSHHYISMSEEMDYQKKATKHILEDVVKNYNSLKSVQFEEKHDVFMEFDKNIANFEIHCLSNLHGLKQKKDKNTEGEKDQDESKSVKVLFSSPRWDFEMFCSTTSILEYLQDQDNEEKYEYVHLIRNGESHEASSNPYSSSRQRHSKPTNDMLDQQKNHDIFQRFEKVMKHSTPTVSFEDTISKIRDIMISMLNSLLHQSIPLEEFILRFNEMKVSAVSFVNISNSNAHIKKMNERFSMLVCQMLYPLFTLIEYSLRKYQEIYTPLSSISEHNPDHYELEDSEEPEEEGQVVKFKDTHREERSLNPLNLDKSSALQWRVDSYTRQFITNSTSSSSSCLLPSTSFMYPTILLASVQYAFRIFQNHQMQEGDKFIIEKTFLQLMIDQEFLKLVCIDNLSDAQICSLLMAFYVGTNDFKTVKSTDLELTSKTLSIMLKITPSLRILGKYGIISVSIVNVDKSDDPNERNGNPEAGQLFIYLDKHKITRIAFQRSHEFGGDGLICDYKDPQFKSLRLTPVDFIRCVSVSLSQQVKKQKKSKKFESKILKLSIPASSISKEAVKQLPKQSVQKIPKYDLYFQQIPQNFFKFDQRTKLAKSDFLSIVSLMFLVPRENMIFFDPFLKSSLIHPMHSEIFLNISEIYNDLSINLTDISMSATSFAQNLSRCVHDLHLFDDIVFPQYRMTFNIYQKRDNIIGPLCTHKDKTFQEIVSTLFGPIESAERISQINQLDEIILNIHKWTVEKIGIHCSSFETLVKLFQKLKQESNEEGLEKLKVSEETKKLKTCMAILKEKISELQIELKHSRSFQRLKEISEKLSKKVEKLMEEENEGMCDNIAGKIQELMLKYEEKIGIHCSSFETLVKLFQKLKQESNEEGLEKLKVSEETKKLKTCMAILKEKISELQIELKHSRSFQRLKEISEKLSKKVEKLMEEENEGMCDNIAGKIQELMLKYEEIILNIHKWTVEKIGIHCSSFETLVKLFQKLKQESNEEGLEKLKVSEETKKLKTCMAILKEKISELQIELKHSRSFQKLKQESNEEGLEKLKVSEETKKLKTCMAILKEKISELQIELKHSRSFQRLKEISEKLSKKVEKLMEEENEGMCDNIAGKIQELMLKYEEVKDNLEILMMKFSNSHHNTPKGESDLGILWKAMISKIKSSKPKKIALFTRFRRLFNVQYYISKLTPLNQIDDPLHCEGSYSTLKAREYMMKTINILESIVPQKSSNLQKLKSNLNHFIDCLMDEIRNDDLVRACDAILTWLKLWSLKGFLDELKKYDFSKSVLNHFQSFLSLAKEIRIHDTSIMSCSYEFIINPPSDLNIRNMLGFFSKPLFENPKAKFIPKRLGLGDFDSNIDSNINYLKNLYIEYSDILAKKLKFEESDPCSMSNPKHNTLIQLFCIETDVPFENVNVDPSKFEPVSFPLTYIVLRAISKQYHTDLSISTLPKSHTDPPLPLFVKDFARSVLLESIEASPTKSTCMDRISGNSDVLLLFSLFKGQAFVKSKDLFIYELINQLSEAPKKSLSKLERDNGKFNHLVRNFLSHESGRMFFRMRENLEYIIRNPQILDDINPYGKPTKSLDEDQMQDMVIFSPLAAYIRQFKEYLVENEREHRCYMERLDQKLKELLTISQVQRKVIQEFQESVKSNFEIWSKELYDREKERFDEDRTQREWMNIIGSLKAIKDVWDGMKEELGTYSFNVTCNVDKDGKFNAHASVISLGRMKKAFNTVKSFLSFLSRSRAKLQSVITLSSDPFCTLKTIPSILETLSRHFRDIPKREYRFLCIHVKERCSKITVQFKKSNVTFENKAGDIPNLIFIIPVNMKNTEFPEVSPKSAELCWITVPPFYFESDSLSSIETVEPKQLSVPLEFYPILERQSLLDYYSKFIKTFEIYESFTKDCELHLPYDIGNIEKCENTLRHLTSEKGKLENIVRNLSTARDSIKDPSEHQFEVFQLKSSKSSPIHIDTSKIESKIQVIDGKFNCKSVLIPIIEPIFSCYRFLEEESLCSILIHNSQDYSNITFSHQPRSDSMISLDEEEKEEDEKEKESVTIDPERFFSLSQNLSKRSKSNNIEILIQFNGCEVPAIDSEKLIEEYHALKIEFPDHTSAILPIKIQSKIVPNIVSLCFESSSKTFGMKDNKIMFEGDLPLKFKISRPEGYLPDIFRFYADVSPNIGNFYPQCVWTVKTDIVSIKPKQELKYGKYLYINSISSCSLPNMSIKGAISKSKRIVLCGIYEKKGYYNYKFEELKKISCSTYSGYKWFKLFMYNGLDEDHKFMIRAESKDLKPAIYMFKTDFVKKGEWIEFKLEIYVPFTYSSTMKQYNLKFHIEYGNSDPIHFDIPVISEPHSGSNPMNWTPRHHFDLEKEKSNLLSHLLQTEKKSSSPKSKQSDFSGASHPHSSQKKYFRNKKEISKEEFESESSKISPCDSSGFSKYPKLELAKQRDYSLPNPSISIQKLEEKRSPKLLRNIQGIYEFWNELDHFIGKIDEYVSCIQIFDSDEEKKKYIDQLEELFLYIQQIWVRSSVAQCPIKSILDQKIATSKKKVDGIVSKSSPSHVQKNSILSPCKRISSGLIELSKSNNASSDVVDPTNHKDNSISSSNSQGPSKSRINSNIRMDGSISSKVVGGSLSIRSSQLSRSLGGDSKTRSIHAKDTKLFRISRPFKPSESEKEALKMFDQSQCFSLDVLQKLTKEQEEIIRDSKDISLKTTVNESVSIIRSDSSSKNPQTPDEYYARTLSILSEVQTSEEDGVPWIVKRSLDQTDIKGKKELVSLISFNDDDDEIEADSFENVRSIMKYVQPMVDKLVGHVCQQRKDGKITFDSTDVVLAIDTHKFLKDEIHSVVLMVFIYSCVLHHLEQRYSIVLFGDHYHQFVVKSIHEPHSDEALQRFIDAFTAANCLITFPLDCFSFIETKCGFGKIGEEEEKMGKEEGRRRKM